MIAATLGALGFAIVVQDDAALRATPSRQAATQATLVQGDLLELRGRRLDHVQVWDHRRERAGYVAADQVRPLRFETADAGALLAVLRFLRDRPGAESLGIAYVAAYLKAVPAPQLDAEAFDALTGMAERLAERAGSSRGVEAERAQRHVEAVRAYGVRFQSWAHDGRISLCYDGEAARRVLQMPADAAMQARAVLALTRPECRDPRLSPSAQRDAGQADAALLARTLDTMPQTLDPMLRNRLQMRRAGIEAEQAFALARAGESPAAAAMSARGALAAVERESLADDDQGRYDRAALTVAASQWAAVAAVAAVSPAPGLTVQTRPGDPGQTCISLHDRGTEALTRCTYGVPWPASARVSADARTLVLAVQPLAGWTELWVFRRQADGFQVQILPPDAREPGLGYVEFAGWVPGGRQMMVARETWHGGRLRRRFELVALDGLATELWASDADRLGAFARWPDKHWRQHTLSLR